MNMNKQEFIDYLSKRNIACSDFQYDQLTKVMESTLETNKSFNLTAIKDENEFLVKMLLDSALAIKNLDLKNKKVIDVGTGAGFPGLVIKILEPEVDMWLLDSSNKKIEYLKNLCKSLPIDCHFICDRAEIFARNNYEKFDFVFSRAVSKLSVLLELSIPMVKVGGSLIALKGPRGNEEIEESKNALTVLKSEVISIDEDILPECEEKRMNIVVQKKSNTSRKYPRSYSLISKKSL